MKHWTEETIVANKHQMQRRGRGILQFISHLLFGFTLLNHATYKYILLANHNDLSSVS